MDRREVPSQVTPVRGFFWISFLEPSTIFLTPGKGRLAFSTISGALRYLSENLGTIPDRIEFE